ncbi:hypothetical protein BH10BAC5_BH10BAC5_08760 [soil metagenome]
MYKTKINVGLMLVAVMLMAVAGSFTGCSKSGTNKSEQTYLDEAKAKYDAKEFQQSIDLYREFVKAYPKSDKAIFAYNQIAGINFESLKNYPETIKTYRELAEKYPQTKEAKQSLFMVAFIYDETMKDKENAKTAYKQFLEKYPNDTDENDKMSESARMMLQTLESGKSIEDMIKENSSSTIDNIKTDSLSKKPKAPVKK